MNWKTITTYLIDWTSTWLKTIELSNWIWKALFIPRAKLKNAKWRSELIQPWIYFLFWLDDNWNDISYVWEAENLFNRLLNHDSYKDFWDVAIVFLSKDNNLTKADVKFLESQIILKAKKVNKYILQNTNTPVPNNLPEYQEATMMEFLKNIDLLIASIWYPIIKEVTKSEINSKKVYFCKWPEAEAKWVYLDDWFLVLKWSYCRKSFSKSTWNWLKIIQSKLINNGIISLYGDNKYIFNVDYKFESPSASAWLILWRSANWWTEWKNKEWNTLDDIERIGKKPL